MRKSPVMVLVCLVFMVTALRSAYAEDFINVIIKPSQHARVSDDTVRGNKPVGLTSLKGTASEPMFRQASYRPKIRAYSQPKLRTEPITKCKLPIFEPAPLCPAPMSGPMCILPKRMWRQVEPAVQVFFANVNANLKASSYYGVFEPPNIDMVKDLGLPSSKVLLEYSLRCQFAPHWAAFYFMMPIQFDAHKTLEKPLWFHNINLSPGEQIYTKWDFTYQRVGLMYQPIMNCNASVGVFAGWTFNEQKTEVKSQQCGGQKCYVLSNTKNMVTAGLEIQKCLQTRCTGATLSCDTRVGMNFFDDAVGVDVQAGLRYSVPMGGNRWGYAKGGYRYLNIDDSRKDGHVDMSLDGGFVEAGMIF